MGKRRRKRYALAVYLLLAALAVILALVGINYYYEDHPMRGLLLSMSTELAGVVLIFFVVNQLFLLDRDRDLFREIESLRNDVRARFSPLAWETVGRRRFDFEAYLHKAQSVDLLGYTLANLIGAFREPLARSISRGTDVRILIVDPEGAAGRLMCDTMPIPEVLSRDTRKCLRYVSEIEQVLEEKGKARGLLAVKMLSWVPSCNMIVVDAGRETGVAKIGIHSLSLRLPLGHEFRDRLYLILSRQENPQEFNYFKRQFDLLWNDEDTIPCDHPLPPDHPLPLPSQGQGGR